MQVHVHDTLKEHKAHRLDFAMKTISEALERFVPTIQRVDASLSEDGHTDTTKEFHCKLSVNAGALGVVVADGKCESIHQAMMMAIERLTRCLEHKIGQRQSKRHAELPELPELAFAEG